MNRRNFVTRQAARSPAPPRWAWREPRPRTPSRGRGDRTVGPGAARAARGVRARRRRGEVTVVFGHTRDDLPRPGAGQAPAQGRRRRREGRGLGVVASRSAGDHQGPGRRQHRRVRVRQPRQARHGHDHHQLHPAARTRPAARTSSSSATTCSTRSTSTTTATRKPDIVYEFRFNDAGCATRTRSSTTPGPIGSLDSPNWNRRQFYYGHARQRSATARKTLGPATWPSPPCNIGPRSTPNYAALAQAAVHHAAARRDGVRRAAQRGLLRRPRVDLRPAATCARSRTCT